MFRERWQRQQSLEVDEVVTVAVVEAASAASADVVALPEAEVDLVEIAVDVAEDLVAEVVASAVVAVAAEASPQEDAVDTDQDILTDHPNYYH